MVTYYSLSVDWYDHNNKSTYSGDDAAMAVGISCPCPEGLPGTWETPTEEMIRVLYRKITKQTS